MKTIISLGLICIGLVIFFFCRLSTGGAIMATIFLGIFYFTIAGAIVGTNHEMKLFDNPYTVSENDAGRMIKIKEIKDGKIGVVTWGYKDYALQELQGYKDYYWMSGFPKGVCNVGNILKIENTDNGIVFKNVKVNGFRDKTKEPFEILEKEYRV